MNERRMQLIGHFINKCSMAIEEAEMVADLNECLYHKMQTSDVRFQFQKKDGSIRNAYGTLRSDVLPQIKGTGRKLNDDLQLFFDLECREFRCFTKSKLVSIISE